MNQWKPNVKTTNGLRKLLAISITAILVFSFIARLFSTNFGSVKISRVVIDSRGATIDGELYYPVGTSDEDKLPAVIVTHGAGCTFGSTKGIAQELARRGFVVLNVSAYGAGLSEMPQNDEYGMGVENYNSRETPGGINDALQFVRTLNFVDQTRIGITGHSQGSRRSSHASQLDAGYLSLNDMLINILYDTFGQTFTEEEITLDANELAKERLTSEQLEYYNYLKDETTQYYNTRVRAQFLIGGDGPMISPLKTVEVAGYEQERNCQLNLGIVIGCYDGYTGYVSAETTLASYYTDSTIDTDLWYAVDDVAKSSATLGKFTDIDAASNEALQNAINNRSARIFCMNTENHATNTFSPATASDIVRFFEQTLGYNRGNIADSSTVRLDPNNTIFMVRAILNCLAMLSMIFMLFPAAALLYKTKFFGRSTENTTDYTTITRKLGKKQGIFLCIISVAFGALGLYEAALHVTPFSPFLPWFPMWINFWVAPVYLAIAGIGAIIVLVVMRYQDKKAGDLSRFKALNIKIGFVNFLKTILASIILLALAYGTLMVITYLFNEDYRLWNVIFTEMKVENWGYVWVYAVPLLILLACQGAATNYAIRPNTSAWKDLLSTVIICSLGTWLVAIVHFSAQHLGLGTIVNMNSVYGMILMTPITIVVTRVMYRITKSIWLGAAVNALLIAWLYISGVGYHTAYIAQSLGSAFFNL